MNYAVIMAGGSGTRFWPKSTPSYPKQFLSLLSERSLLQNTVDRILPVIPLEHIFVVTNASYVGIVEEQLPGLPKAHIIAESVARNTAPCVAITAALIHKHDPDAVIAVLPADHYISNPDEYQRALSAAFTKAHSGNFLVTIGISPNRPETGFGYIQAKSSEKDSIDGFAVFRVESFREKPDLKTATQFLESGNFVWNSGMFVWKSSSIIASFQKNRPEMIDSAIAATEQLFSGTPDAIDRFYETSESISIDYAIMEHADNVFVIPAEFGWSDVGSWSAVFELLSKKHDGIVALGGNVFFLDSKDCLIHSDSTRPVAVIGLKNVAVIDTKNGLLVCSLDNSQDVKKALDFVRERGLTEFL